jgi:hypothetical protein
MVVKEGAVRTGVMGLGVSQVQLGIAMLVALITQRPRMDSQDTKEAAAEREEMVDSEEMLEQ